MSGRAWIGEGPKVRTCRGMVLKGGGRGRGSWLLVVVEMVILVIMVIVVVVGGLVIWVCVDDWGRCVWWW